MVVTINTPSVKSAVKRLGNITVSDLRGLSTKDLVNITTKLPIVIEHAKGEIERRNAA